MADSLELILQVCPAPGGDAGKLAELMVWLCGELPDLDVQRVDQWPGEAVPVGVAGSADIAGLLLVHLDPKALPVLLAKVDDWAARSDRMVEISCEGHPLKLGRPTRQHQEKIIDGPLVPDTQATQVAPEGDTEPVMEVTPSAVPNRDSPVLETGKELDRLRPGKSLPSIWRSPRESSELSRKHWLADACIFVKGGIIEAPPGQESGRTAVFAGISSLLATGFAVLLSLAILAIAKHLHGFTISTRYPVHRVYQGVVRYFVHVTPPPGSPHMLLVYTVYLAVLPVLFAVVFMHLRVGSTRLIVAAVACVIFMAAPFVIAVTSIRTGSTNCGSWNYPEPNSGAECYNDLETVFRIAFAVGIVGIAVPVICLVRGRRHRHEDGLLHLALSALTITTMAVFRFIRDLRRRQARGGRNVTAHQKTVAAIDKYLLPHERQVIALRQHPAVLIGSIVLTLAWPVAAGVLTATILHDNEPLITAVWIAWLALIARMIWKAIDWTRTFFVVTPQRFLLASGVLTSKVAMLPLSKVTDMSVHRSPTGRLLGFGEFIMESAEQDQALRRVDHIPYPDQLYLEICGLIFKSFEPDEPDPGDDRARQD
jgi:membrane protein YdbS with pleckstrin-like domain